MPSVPKSYRSVKSASLSILEDDQYSCSWHDLGQIVGNIQWLVPGWVPLGMLTGIIAQPKAGKSGFALAALAKPIITGCNWFTGDSGPKEGFVLYCDTENSGKINISRAEQWGIPKKRVRTPFREDPLTPINLENDEHIAEMMRTIDHYKIELAIIDSLRGGHDGLENDSRLIIPLKKLATVAEATGAAVCIIHHAKKMQIGEDMTINAARGSNSFLAAVRCQIAIDIPDPRPNAREAWRRCQVMGENLGTAPPPIGFRFNQTGVEIGSCPVRPELQDEKAVKWLEEKMDPGVWYDAARVAKEAEQEGLSHGGLQRAREKLGITKPIYVKKAGDTWQWCRPESV